MTMDEGDTMTCRACGQDGRASEGYPCVACGTFLCIRCNLRGVTLCAACAQKQTSERADPSGRT